MSITIPISFQSDDHAFWTFAVAKKMLGASEPTFSFTKSHDISTEEDIVRIESHGAYAWPEPIGLLTGGAATRIIQAINDGYSLRVASYDTVDLPEGNILVSMVVDAHKDDMSFKKDPASKPPKSFNNVVSAEGPDNSSAKSDFAHKWKKLMDKLLQEHPQHGSLLIKSVPISDDGETLVIQLPKGSAFPLKMLQRSDVGHTVSRAVTQEFGPRRLEYRVNGGDRVVMPSLDDPGNPIDESTVQAPIRVPVPTSTPATTDESASGARRLPIDYWEDAIQTMSGSWPILFRFTRMVSDDGATVTIWVPKWSELDARFNDEDRSINSAKKTAETAIEKTLGPRDVVFWRAGDYRPIGCDAPAPEPYADLDTLSEQEKRLERAIRPYLSRDLPADFRSLIYGTRNLDLSSDAGTRVTMFCIDEYVGYKSIGYQYIVQYRTNIILRILQSVGLEIVSIDRTCTNVDKKHLMHHITIAYR